MCSRSSSTVGWRSSSGASRSSPSSCDCSSSADGGFGEIASAVVLFSLFAGIIIVAFRWWVWHNTEYVITNRRLLNASGILNKRSADSSLEKINDAILEVNVVGRLLGYGDLKILTAADAAIDRYRMLNDATEFKKVMMSAKHALQSGEIRDGDDYRPTDSGSAATAAAVADAARPAAPVEAPIDLSGGADPLKADTPEEVAAVLAQLSTPARAGRDQLGRVRDQEEGAPGPPVIDRPAAG